MGSGSGRERWRRRHGGRDGRRRFRERSFLLSANLKILIALASAGMFVAWGLFIRMAIELNRVSPIQKKFYVINLRRDFHEVKRLHEEIFPVSALRTAWLILIIASEVTPIAVIILAVRPR